MKVVKRFSDAPISVKFVSVDRRAEYTELIKRAQATQKTRLDRINAMRMVQILKQQLKSTLLPFALEPYDTLTRSSVWHQVNSFLENLKSRGAIIDYCLVCDSTNNSAESIDSNQLHVDVAFKLQRAEDFIYLPTVLKKQSTKFEELYDCKE